MENINKDLMPLMQQSIEYFHPTLPREKAKSLLITKGIKL